ncbi:MAG: deoxyribodipyrimidine photo-lyase, partial [Phycisphaeraceae bacterium]|nr:deoxyribodipyrimidine photo-lyase [Phycisphaeraceae bacterium]
VEPSEPRGTPDHLAHPDRWPASVDLDRLGLLPEIDWASGIADAWDPGEAAASDRLEEFLATTAADYKEGRDAIPADLTSRLSPHLWFGEISVRRAYADALESRRRRRNEEARTSIDEWLRQLGWRDFAHGMLAHFPETLTEPMQEKFEGFPWREDPEGLKAWQRGRTGYPIVDAAMRCLWTTGWMHNRLRMIVASFLCKDLLIHWHEGARWFEHTLVDADLANNRFGWQWTAGCGADAAPFFRIFNPITQGKKFDPEGVFVRKWVDEITDLDDRYIHEPWEADDAELEAAGVSLDEAAREVKYAGDRTPGRYPPPIIDHADARDRALDAWDQVK